MNPTPTHALDVLADPSRREVLRRVSSGAGSVAELARDLPISRAAVSQHLARLQAAQLVRYDVVGTRHRYELDPRGLAALRGWLDDLWTCALDAFRREAELAMNEEPGGSDGR